jgi:hypothetical protein
MHIREIILPQNGRPPTDFLGGVYHHFCLSEHCGWALCNLRHLRDQETVNGRLFDDTHMDRCDALTLLD